MKSMQKKTNNAEAYYNAGNAYYKEKQYLKALSAYSFARIQNKKSRSMKLSNMGNALVRLGTKNTLERAVKHYEASLKLNEDKLTRENLEAVKKALEDSKDKSDKKKEEEQKKEDKKYSEQKTDAKGDDADEANDKNNKNKNRDKKNKGDSKGKKSDNKLNPNNKKRSDDGDSKEDNDNNKGSNNNNNGNAKQQTKELKDKNKKEVTNRSDDTKSGLKLQVMSDLEQTKWVKKLNSKQNTYLYRLNEEKNKKNEKNW